MNLIYEIEAAQRKAAEKVVCDNLEATFPTRPRTLDEITTAVRRAEPVTTEELTAAVCAYDVLLSRLDLPSDPVRLHEYFAAGDSDPRTYYGPENDPGNPDAVHWHKTMIGAEICQNCDTSLPEGCGGIFKNDGDSCRYQPKETNEEK